jgi:uncharacterized membrane protein
MTKVWGNVCFLLIKANWYNNAMVFLPMKLLNIIKNVIHHAGRDQRNGGYHKCVGIEIKINFKTVNLSCYFENPKISISFV